MAVSLGVTGCATGSPPGSTPTPTVVTRSVTVPAGGVSLAELGFRHGPTGLLTVPAGVRLTQRVDQPNLLTAGFAAPNGDEITGWLRSQLPVAGFRITAQGPGALLFTGHGWSGAFATGGGESALTLRRDD